MREAYSGIVNIFFIAVFLVIVSGILAFIVTYTKAFKMKNIVISTVEQYEGSGCTSDSSSCFARIKERAKNIRFSPSDNLKCPSSITNNYSYTNVGGLYCIGVPVAKNVDGTSKHYNIIVKINFYFPIFSQFLGFNVFQVSGNTASIDS